LTGEEKKLKLESANGSLKLRGDKMRLSIFPLNKNPIMPKSGRDITGILMR